jgi:hypothetical protein
MKLKSRQTSIYRLFLNHFAVGLVWNKQAYNESIECSAVPYKIGRAELKKNSSDTSSAEHINTNFRETGL